MSILIVTTNIHTPHYISQQYDGIKKYIKGVNEHKYVVLCDAYKGVKCLLNENIEAYDEIKKECNKIGDKCQFVGVNQRECHSGNKNGSIRHAEILEWFSQNIDNIIPTYRDYQYLLIIDSDLFFKKEINIKQLLNDKNCATPIINTPELDMFYVVVIFLLMDITKLHDFKNINYHPIPNKTDTGGKTYDYFKDKRNDINCIYEYESLYHFYKNLSRINKLKKNLPDIWLDGAIFHIRVGTYVKLHNLSEFKINFHMTDYFKRLLKYHINIDSTSCSKKIKNILNYVIRNGEKY